MKAALIAFSLVAGVCILGLLLGLAGKALFTGESFPPPKMENKAVYYIRVPASSPISP